VIVFVESKQGVSHIGFNDEVKRNRIDDLSIYSIPFQVTQFSIKKILRTSNTVLNQSSSKVI